MNQTPENSTQAAAEPVRVQYSTTVDAILDRHLGPGAHRAHLRSVATGAPTEQSARMVHDAAVQAVRASAELASALNAERAEIGEALLELAVGGPLEHLVGRRSLPKHAARYTDALCHLEDAARAHAALTPAAGRTGTYTVLLRLPEDLCETDLSYDQVDFAFQVHAPGPETAHRLAAEEMLRRFTPGGLPDDDDLEGACDEAELIGIAAGHIAWSGDYPTTITVAATTVAGAAR